MGATNWILLHLCIAAVVALSSTESTDSVVPENHALVEELAIPKQTPNMTFESVATSKVKPDAMVDPADDANAELNSDGAPVLIESLSPHAEAFVHDAMAEMRLMCGTNSSFSATLSSISQQTVAGELYQFMYHVTDSLGATDHVVKIMQPVTPQVHEIPGSLSSPNDAFEFVSIQPRVCSLQQMSSNADSLTTKQSLIQSMRSTGYKPRNEPAEMIQMSKVSAEDLDALPKDFDWRHHTKGARAVDVTYNQGSCGACYAFAATTAFGYRLFVKSGGRFDVWPSPQSGISCYHFKDHNGVVHGGCEGGSATVVYNGMEHTGFPAHWCNPYNFHDVSLQKPTQCSASCGDSLLYSAVPGSTKVIGRRHERFTDVQSSNKEVADMIRYELYHNGPAMASLLSHHLNGYKGFGIIGREEVLDVKDSIDHAVTLMGWGEEDGVEYWVIQNSWGPAWGEKGFGRIRRGVNGLGIEFGGIESTIPQIPSKCNDAPICQNSGSYNSDCSCHCMDGFSGPQCQKCERTCDHGVSSVIDGKCMCQCPPTWYTFGDDLKHECATSIMVDGVQDEMVTKLGPKAVKVQITNPSGQAGLVGRDYFVAAPQGIEPHSRAEWHPEAIKSWVCSESGEPFVCGKDAWTNCHEYACDSRYTGPYGAYTMQYECQKFCAAEMKESPAELTGLKPGTTYELYMFKYLGKSEFGVDKGWAMGTEGGFKLSQRVFVDPCFDSDEHCHSYLHDENYACDETPWGGSYAGHKVSKYCEKSCGICGLWSGTPAPLPLSATDAHQLELEKVDVEAEALEAKTRKIRAHEKEAKERAQTHQKMKTKEEAQAAALKAKLRAVVELSEEQAAAEAAEKDESANLLSHLDVQKESKQKLYSKKEEIIDKEADRIEAETETSHKEAEVKHGHAMALNQKLVHEHAVKQQLKAKGEADVAAQEEAVAEASLEVEEKKSAVMKAQGEKSAAEAQGQHLLTELGDTQQKGVRTAATAESEAKKAAEFAEEVWKSKQDDAAADTSVKAQAITEAKQALKSLQDAVQPCLTTVKQQCHFPFTYGGVEHEVCTAMDHTRRWCITEANTWNWGNCAEGCPTLEERTAEKAKVSAAVAEVARVEGVLQKAKNAILKAAEDEQAQKKDAQANEEAAKKDATEQVGKKTAKIDAAEKAAKARAATFTTTIPHLKASHAAADVAEKETKATLSKGYEHCGSTTGGTAEGESCMFPFRPAWNAPNSHGCSTKSFKIDKDGYFEECGVYDSYPGVEVVACPDHSKCIPITWVCDGGKPDCADGSDEAGCVDGKQVNLPKEFEPVKSARAWCKSRHKKWGWCNEGCPVAKED